MDNLLENLSTQTVHSLVVYLLSLVSRRHSIGTSLDLTDTLHTENNKHLSCPTTNLSVWCGGSRRTLRTGNSGSWMSRPLTAVHNVSHYNVIQASAAEALHWPRSGLFMGSPPGRWTWEETQLKDSSLGSAKCCSVRPAGGRWESPLEHSLASVLD